MNRRQFATTLALGLAAAAVPDLAAQKPKPRKLRCGHTGITWGFRPEDAERAIADVASLGFYRYESFGNVLEAWEPKGGLDKLLQSAKLPLRSAYCPVNLTTRRSGRMTSRSSFAGDN
jgi:inosose dehydratase